MDESYRWLDHPVNWSRNSPVLSYKPKLDELLLNLNIYTAIDTKNHLDFNH
jgi:hypothetical protein